MKKNILEIYALTACFVLMLVFVFDFSKAIYGGFKSFFPIITMDSEDYVKHQSNKSFAVSLQNEEYSKTIPQDDKLTEIRKESWEKTIAIEKRDGFHNILNRSISILIISILFLVHWKIGKKARQSVA